MSEMIPPTEVSEDEPNVPAKKRNTSRASSELAPQQAALKMVNGTKVAINMRRRPKTSEQGAQSRGPTTKPRTKTDVTDDELGQMVFAL